MSLIKILLTLLAMVTLRQGTENPDLQGLHSIYKFVSQLLATARFSRAIAIQIM